MFNSKKRILFDPDSYTLSDAHKKVYGFYERLYTVIEFLAALMFVVGSIFYFYPELDFYGTCLFLVGSLFFMARPFVTMAREFNIVNLPLPGDEKP